MKKNLCLAVWGAALCATFPAAAETALPAAAEVSENASSPAETVADAASLTANIKRIAVEYLEHSVTNKDDPNYPGLYAIYGKSKTTENGVTTENENDDEILLYTDYTHKIWHLEQGIVGPFAYLGYETEFTDFNLDGTDYRTKILRAKTGLKLYDSENFKQLYIALVEEDDMTYKNDNMKTGAEIGYEFHYPLNPNTTFVSEGYYRHFFSYSQKEATDFKYKLSTNNRIETKLVGDLYLAPFYNYELAETRGASRSRAQSTFGLSLSYNKSFDLF